MTFCIPTELQESGGEVVALLVESKATLRITMHPVPESSQANMQIGVALTKGASMEIWISKGGDLSFVSTVDPGTFVIRQSANMTRTQRIHEIRQRVEMFLMKRTIYLKRERGLFWRLLRSLGLSVYSDLRQVRQVGI